MSESDSKRQKVESSGGIVLPKENSNNINNNNNQPGLTVNANAAKKESGSGALSPTDPDKVADALYGTGVDLKEEESLLNRESERNKAKLAMSSQNNHQRTLITQLVPLMNRAQVYGYAKREIESRGLKIPPGQERAFADFLSVACEEMMTPVLRDFVMHSRHRRRNIKSSNGNRSDVAKALRDYASKQKELEDKRTTKKIKLGIELDDGVAKPKADELSHRAANATAALMTSGRTKTYSWMTGGGGGAGAGSGGGSGSGKSKTAEANDGKGVRFREARQEELFSVRDLVKALETKRRGVDRTLVKSYGKLKDSYR